MTRTKDKDYYTKDIDKEIGYRKKYTSSLRTLINILNGMIEYETHDELRDEYKSLLNHITKRLHGIYDMFNQ